MKKFRQDERAEMVGLDYIIDAGIRSPRDDNLPTTFHRTLRVTGARGQTDSPTQTVTVP